MESLGCITTRPGRGGFQRAVSRSERAWSGRLCHLSAESGGTAYPFTIGSWILAAVAVLTCDLILIPGHALERQNIEIDHDSRQFLCRYYSVNRAKVPEATEA